MTSKPLSYRERAALCLNPVAKKLLSLMEEKQSNLCLAASEITDKDSLLQLAEKIGSEIVILKTHIDILDNFEPSFIEHLTQLSQDKRFLIFEDRKFADIGNTARQQYEGGLYRIADWAHLTNAHIIPGPGIIQGLKSVGLPKNRALLLLAEMSSAGNLCDAKYIANCVKMADEHKDFVIGFISQRKLLDDPRFIYFSPGVSLKAKGDALGQQYNSPEVIIRYNHSDVIIVGRAIHSASNPLEEAKRYRHEGWNAYLSRCAQ